MLGKENKLTLLYRAISFKYLLLLIVFIAVMALNSPLSNSLQSSIYIKQSLNCFTLAPVSFLTQKEIEESFLDSLQIDDKNPLAIKVLLLALEKMNKQYSALYLKLTNKLQAEKNGSASASPVIDFNTLEFWSKLKSSTKEQRLEMLNLLTKQHIAKTLGQLHDFGLDVLAENRGLVMDIAKVYAKQDAKSTIEFFDFFGFDLTKDADRENVIEIAKICAEQDVKSTLLYFEKFGLDGKKASDKAGVIAVADICAKKSGANTAFYFAKFGLDASKKTERAAVINIAKMCANSSVENTLHMFEKFGLDGSNPRDKQVVIEIAKICATQNGANTAEYFKTFGLDVTKDSDREAVVEIVKLCVTQSVGQTLYHFEKFGLDGSRKKDKNAVVEIAEICAQQSGGATAEYFEKFSLDVNKGSDRKSIIDIVKMCAKHDGLGTGSYLKNFGFDIVKDKAVVTEIAKIGARYDANGIAKVFKNFELDGAKDSDRQDVIEIAKICAEQSGRQTAEYFKNFGLDGAKDSDRKAVIEIAKACAMHYGHDTGSYFKNFGLDLKTDDVDIAILRYLLKGKDIPWDKDKVTALGKFLEKGILTQENVDLKELYILLRKQKLINPDEIAYMRERIPLDSDESAAEANLVLLEQEDKLIEHNNNAIKILGYHNIDKQKALLAILETEQMLSVYHDMFSDSLTHIEQQLKEIKQIVNADTDVLSPETKKLLREITGGVVSLQDIIVYLHQHSIRKMFAKFASVEEKVGTELQFHVGFAKQKAVDILNLAKSEIYYSGIKFLEDFYRNRYKVLLGMQTIVTGKKLYHFFQLGVHTAKMAIDLHAPLTGGNVLFEYNENQYDIVNKEHKEDVCGNDIRQLVVKEVLNRSGMQVDSEGLNVHAIFDKESGAQSVEELSLVYEKIYYLLYILATKAVSLEGEEYNISDTMFGEDYRKRKNKDLFPDNKLLKKMVQENANIIEELIKEHLKEKKEADAEDIDIQGFGKVGLSTIEYLEKAYQETQPIKNVESYLQEIFADDIRYQESRKIAQSLGTIKDLFVWETELETGKYKVVKTEVEIGYKDKDILYGLEDQSTGEIVLGFMKRGVSNETIYDFSEFINRVKKEGMYPVEEGPFLEQGQSKADILNGFQEHIEKNKEAISAKGLSASSGIAEGEIIIYKRGMHNLGDLSGKIVVVDNLMPEDDTYIMGAKGLIILKGGALSHGAIFAREMGVAAIILNSFNIEKSLIQGYSSVIEKSSEVDFKIGETNVRASFLNTVKKKWIIKEGDIVKLDGEKGELSNIDENKQQILKLVAQGNSNVEQLAALAQKYKLEKWLYAIAYNEKKELLQKYLEQLIPTLELYGKELAKKQENDKLHDIENLINTLVQIDAKWKTYSVLANLEKIFQEISVDQKQKYEAKIAKILETKKIYKSEKVVQAKEIESKDYYDLEEVDESLMSVLGNKVAKLGGDTISLVQEAGGQVPAGIGLNGELSRRFYEINYNGRPLKEIIKEILKGEKSIKAKSAEIQKLLGSIEVKKSKEYKALEVKLNEIHEMKWGNQDVVVAVRSSAILKGKQLEDTVGTAGLYKSNMFVEKEGFFDSVVDVWKSLYSEEALNYYVNVFQNADFDALVQDLQMGVVGQEMIDSDVSVVAFSANPSSGVNEIIITAGYGQGEGVVSGIVPVDTIVIDALSGQIISEDIAKKDEILVKREGKNDLQRVNLEEEAQKSLNVLFVCTDNSSRSVMSEYLLKDLLKDKDNIHISSGGFYAGSEPDISQETLAVLAEVGIDANGHKLKTISQKDLGKADLIIVMSDYQKEEIIELDKELEGKTLNLSEFAKEQKVGDIINPYGKDLDVYRESLQELKSIFESGENIHGAVSEMKRKATLDKINKPALSKKEVDRIVKIVKALADEYENPQDVEIAVGNREINVVQRRMITTLGIDAGENYYNRLRRFALEDKIKLQIVKLRERNENLNFLEFMFAVSYALNENDELFLDNRLLDFIEKQWNSFKILPAVTFVNKGKALLERAV